jgi:hypothetical protein
VTAIHKHRAAAGATPRLNVPPPVSDHETLIQVDIPVPRGIQKHSGFRFPARAVITIIMAADPDVIERNAVADPLVRGVDLAAFRCTAGYVGLICDHNQQETMVPQFEEGFRNSRKQFQLIRTRWIGFAVDDHGTVDHTITVKENGAPGHLVDSHFAGAS